MRRGLVRSRGIAPTRWSRSSRCSPRSRSPSGGSKQPASWRTRSGTFRHAALYPGDPRGRSGQDPGDGRGRSGARGRLRIDLRGRQTLRSPAGAVVLLAGRGVLPRRAGADVDDLGVLRDLPPDQRRRLPGVLVGDLGADALQRRCPGGGLSRRHQCGAQGAGRGGVRDRHAQIPGDARDPAPLRASRSWCRRSSASAWWC
jgi:hypothetical protein